MDPTIALAMMAVCWEAATVVTNAPETFAPVDVKTGCDGYNEKTQITIADDPKSWNDAWLAYRVGPVIGNGSNFLVTSTDAPPDVDFNKNFVIVVFGSAGTVNGYDVADSFRKDKEVHVRLRPTYMSGAASGLKVYPYGFFVFPRTKYPIEVEFPATDADGNESWHSVAKLPPPKPVQ